MLHRLKKKGRMQGMKFEVKPVFEFLHAVSSHYCIHTHIHVSHGPSVTE